MICVVNGDTVHIRELPGMTLAEVKFAALTVLALSRPASDFEIRTESGVWLDPASEIPANVTIVYITLSAGHLG